MQTQILDLSKLPVPKRAPFGEFLVENRVLNRFQLFRVLQMQDRSPGTRLGHCAVALGFAAHTEIEQLHVSFVACSSM